MVQMQPWETHVNAITLCRSISKATVYKDLWFALGYIELKSWLLRRSQEIFSEFLFGHGGHKRAEDSAAG